MDGGESMFTRLLRKMLLKSMTKGHCTGGGGGGKGHCS